MPERFPDYAYVPGFWPQKARPPRGRGVASSTATLSLPQWRQCAPLNEGFALFDRGYYWEAHEAWEEPYRAAAPGTAARAFCQGLIALAAAGVKVRQGLPSKVAHFGARAGDRFREARALCPGPWDGLDPRRFEAFADYVQLYGPWLRGHPDEAVQVVFTRTLSP